MPLWLWVLITVSVVVGGLYLATLPARRLRRGLSGTGGAPMPSRDARRAEATAIDPQTIATRQAGPNTGYGSSGTF
jgi:hypothetical protein